MTIPTQLGSISPYDLSLPAIQNLDLSRKLRFEIARWLQKQPACWISATQPKNKTLVFCYVCYVKYQNIRNISRGQAFRYEEKYRNFADRMNIFHTHLNTWKICMYIYRTQHRASVRHHPQMFVGDLILLCCGYPRSHFTVFAARHPPRGFTIRMKTEPMASACWMRCSWLHATKEVAIGVKGGVHGSDSGKG